MPTNTVTASARTQGAGPLSQDMGWTVASEVTSVDRSRQCRINKGETEMVWQRPKIREICIGMEINGYLPAEI